MPKLKTCLKVMVNPQTTLPGIGHHISFPATAVDYEYVFPPRLLVRMVMTGINYE